MSETHTTPSTEVHSSVDTEKQQIIESAPTDIAALDSTTLEGHTHEVEMSAEPKAADSQPTAEESKVSQA
jgi:hypothetical protein